MANTWPAFGNIDRIWQTFGIILLAISLHFEEHFEFGEVLKTFRLEVPSIRKALHAWEEVQE